MPADPDTVLLETVTTHRARLHAAFLYGQLAERRTPNDNVKRALAGTVLAGVACAGCIGFAVVTGLADHGGRTPAPATPPTAAVRR
jgi:hypothetical protein